MQQQSNYIPNLTPLRGIAALMVAVYHFEELGARFLNPAHSMLIRKGYLMVDLFFVMSGFIMLHVYGESFSKGLRWNVFKKFITARFARLYPLHFFTLMLAIVFFYSSHAPANPIENPAAIPTNLLLLQSFGIHQIFTWNVPSWSISAEWWAYMVFPLLVLMLSKNKIVANVFMLVFSTGLYISILYFLPRVNPFMPAIPVPHDLNVTYDFGFLRGLAGFMAGMVTYGVYQNIKWYSFFSKDIVAIVCIALLLTTMHFGANDILYIPFFMTLVLAIASNHQTINKIFMVKPLQYVGDISYSIYLIHCNLIFLVAVPIFQKMGLVYKGPGSVQIPFWTGLLVCTIFLASVILVSSVTYFLIEKPCRKWINKRVAKEEKISIVTA